MLPELIIGGLTIPTYMLMHLVGRFIGIIAFVLAARWTLAAAKRISNGALVSSALASAIFGPLASIVFYFLWRRDRENRDWLLLSAIPVLLIVGTLASRVATFVIHGPELAMMGAADGPLISLVTAAATLMATVVFALFSRISLLRLFDAGILLGVSRHALGKVGCFLVGCCHGGVCDGPLCLSFPADSQVAHTHQLRGLIDATVASLPVHPVQLYRALGAAAVAIALAVVLRRTPSVAGVAGAVGLFAVIAIELGLSFLRDWSNGIPMSHMGGLAAGLVGAAVIGVAAFVAGSTRRPEIGRPVRK